MTRAHRLYHPDAIAERAELRRQIKADLPIVTPVWIAGPGGAALCATPTRVPFPKPRNHAEEIANALALRDQEQTDEA